MISPYREITSVISEDKNGASVLRFVLKVTEPLYCPNPGCNNLLKPYDTVPRLLKDIETTVRKSPSGKKTSEEVTTAEYIIPRFCCDHCKAEREKVRQDAIARGLDQNAIKAELKKCLPYVTRILSDDMWPYKHFALNFIRDVAEGVYSLDDIANMAGGPCEGTCLNWNLAVRGNLPVFEEGLAVPIQESQEELSESEETETSVYDSNPEAEDTVTEESDRDDETDVNDDETDISKAVKKYSRVFRVYQTMALDWLCYCLKCCYNNGIRPLVMRQLRSCPT